MEAEDAAAAPEEAAPPALPPPPEAADAGEPFEEPVTPAPAPAGGIPVEVQADETEGDAKNDLVNMNGAARVVSEEREIRADHITANTRTKDVTAEGSVRVTGDGRRIEGRTAHGNLRDRTVSVEGGVRYTSVLQVPNKRLGPRDLPLNVTADRLDFDFTKRTGSIQNVETILQGVRVRGASGVLLPDQRLQIQGAEFSFCPIDEGTGRYGYHLRAKSIDYDPQRGGIAHRATLYIGKNRIITLGRYHVAPGEGSGRQHIPLPRFGSSRLSGSFLSFGIQPSLTENIIADTRLVLTTKVGPRIFTTVRPVTGGPNPFFRVHLKEEVVGRDPKRLLIDRLPEVGFLLDDLSESRWSRWVRGEISYGYIRQHDPNRRTGRALLSLLAQPIPLQDWGRWRLSARPGIQVSTYSTGENYRDLFGELSLARRWTVRRSMQFGVRKHVIGGSTPFKFDEALIPNELFTRVRWSWGAWGALGDTRWDLGRKELFDARIGIGKVTRCVEPRLVYSTRLKEIRLEVNLIGLTDTSELPPAGTVPVPSVNDPVTRAEGCEACGEPARVSKR
jgi:hypothetical protein